MGEGPTAPHPFAKAEFEGHDSGKDDAQQP
jgi:hypothetical protein